jgi:hypothetical protein
MVYVEPWGTTQGHPARLDPWNEATEARYLSATYQEERRQASALTEGGRPHPHMIPEPLLRITSRAVLVCKVLVPAEVADDARAEASTSLYREEQKFPGQCCAHLMVHINDRPAPVRGQW